MSKKISIIFLFLFFLSFVFIPVYVNAESIFGTLPDCFASPPTKECTICDVIGMIVGVAKFILGFVGVLALLLFVWGGFGLIISAGNEEAVKKNKGILVGTLVGIIIVFVAWQIVWLTVATLMHGNISGVPKNGLTILGQDWSNICGTREKESQPLTSPPIAPIQGGVERGKECSTTIPAQLCQKELTCAKHLEQNKWICINPGKISQGQPCIPNITKRECQNDKACHDNLPNDCATVIVCGICQ